MNTFLFILLVVAMAAVAYVLVRGVIAMAQRQGRHRRGPAGLYAASACSIRRSRS